MRESVQLFGVILYHINLVYKYQNLLTWILYGNKIDIKTAIWEPILTEEIYIYLSYEF